MLKRILAATDGSENAERAVRLASEIACCFQAPLLLAHVIVPEPSPEEIGNMRTLMKQIGHTPFAPLHPEELRDRLSREHGAEAVARPEDAAGVIGRHHLKQAAVIAEEAGVTEVETRLLEGRPAHSIVDLARERGCDLVAVGTRGVGAVKGLLFGSISRTISERIETSCLIVP